MTDPAKRDISHLEFFSLNRTEKEVGNRYATGFFYVIIHRSFHLTIGEKEWTKIVKRLYQRLYHK